MLRGFWYCEYSQYTILYCEYPQYTQYQRTKHCRLLAVTAVPNPEILSGGSIRSNEPRNAANGTKNLQYFRSKILLLNSQEHLCIFAI